MAKKKTHSLRNLPPCPDPDKYILIKTKEGNFWRRKRGTVKETVLNDAFQRSSEVLKIVMPAAKRILANLEPFTRSLKMGRITVKIGAKLRKTFDSTGKLKLSVLNGMDFQEEFPLHKLLLCDYTVQQGKEEIKVIIPLKKGEVQKQNNLATDYYFELILLYGDADKEKALKLRSAESPLYPFGKQIKAPCEMELPLPAGKKPWMLLLKVNCLEGNETALHHKHYAMKVVKTGGE